MTEEEQDEKDANLIQEIFDQMLIDHHEKEEKEAYKALMSERREKLEDEYFHELFKEKN